MNIIKKNKILDKIGGEFEINPLDLKGANSLLINNNFLFSSGRSAFWYALLSIKNDNNVIHLPYYICDSIIEICLKAKKDIKFYELGQDWLIPLDYLEKINKNDILLSVNYFGIISDNKRINEIKKEREDIIIISDHVQSYWTCEKSNADYYFTGLRKHFSIPEGGLLFYKQKMVHFGESISENNFYRDKLIGSIFKFWEFDDLLYLRYFESGESLINSQESPTKASKISTFLFKNYDTEIAAKFRRKNYKFIYDYGSALNINFVFPYFYIFFYNPYLDFMALKFCNTSVAESALLYI
jgi:hypothetical protein